MLLSTRYSANPSPLVYSCPRTLAIFANTHDSVRLSDTLTPVIFFNQTDPIKRLRVRYILAAIALATLPCYLTGYIAAQWRLSQTPTPTASATSTASATPTNTSTPTNTPTETPTPTHTSTKTNTWTPTWTFTPTLTPSFTNSYTPTPLPTDTPTQTPTLGP